MIIREATRLDAPSVAEIWNAEIRSGVTTFNSREKTVTELEAQIRERGAGFQVAENEGVVVGFATYFPFRGGVGYAHTKEHTIYLSPKAQGLGAGRALMNAILTVAKEAGGHFSRKRVRCAVSCRLRVQTCGSCTGSWLQV